MTVNLTPAVTDAAPTGRTRVIALQPIVAGRVDTRECGDLMAELPGVSVMTRYPAEEDLRAVEAGKYELAAELRGLGLRDVSLFLHRVGTAWLERIDDIGREYRDVIEETTGLTWTVVRADYETIGRMLTSRVDHYQMLRSELGSVHAMDEWHRNESVRQRAVGRGIVFHSLVGNIPVAGLYSLFRGLLTRNANLLKLASRDPLSVYLFARCVVETVPDSPLARGVSALYWPRSHELAARFARLADAACLWGSGEAIQDIRTALRPSAPCVTFGPRRSCAIVDLTVPGVDVEDAARRMAVEVAFYNQEACLSPLRVYVLGDPAEFEKRLTRALDRATDMLPRAENGIDAEAYVRLITEEARVRGWSVRTGDGWSSITAPADEATMPHPLGRTVFIHPCADLDEIARWMDDDLQTIAVFPHGIAQTVADRVLVSGGSRVAELGLSRHPRRGFPHDGLRVLNSLVRWVAIEDDMVEGSIYGVLSAEDLHRFFVGL